MFARLGLILSLGFSVFAHADLPDPGDIAKLINSPQAYSCQVILVAAGVGLNDGIFKYQVGSDNDGVHGGKDFNFTFADHQITTISNGKWLGVTWVKAGKVVASGVFASNLANDGSQALIIYNPANTNEQVSVDCTRI